MNSVIVNFEQLIYIMNTNKTAQERFFQSCKIGDLNKIKTDLFYNVSPLCQDKYGNNALHLACMYNQPKVLEYMLKTVKTYKTDTQNKLGRTALNIAASQGAFECIDILLNNLKCNINSADKNFKNTPLHWCVSRKCANGVKKLLNWGADYTIINKFGKTPIELAKIMCLDIYNLIDEFVENKNKCLQNSRNTNSKINSKLSSNLPQFKITNESSTFNSKIYKDTINQQNDNGETVLEPDLASNDSFFLDISKLKHGDNSVLNLLEKSIEPVDETSFVSSILNSGKVIQLTEAGILALEYTKNEINTPIPDRVVKSFLTTSQQHNDNKNHADNDTIEKNDQFDSKTNFKGLKRLQSPQPCSKKFKHTKTDSDNKSDVDNLLEQLSSNFTKTTPKVCNFNSYCLQSSSSVVNDTIKNNEVCNKNQLVCFNSDINAQPQWVEDLMCLLQNLDNTDIVDCN